ncbi:maleate cis-trans isomerase family protein [Parasphingorhabdus pacifica]
MRGDSATIGLITAGSNTGALAEYRELLPAGIDVVATDLTSPQGEMSIEALTAMSAEGNVEQAAHRLRQRGVDCVLFGCTATSLARGPRWDRTVALRIERTTGLPTMTTATAALKAFRAMRLQRLALVTPHTAELDALEGAFFEQSGFDIASVGGAEHRPEEIDTLTSDDFAWHTDLMRLRDADGVFVSCAGWRIADTVSHLEQVHRRPIVTSNLAGVWAALRMLDIPDPLIGYGKLLRIAELPADTDLPHTSAGTSAPHPRNPAPAERLLAM